VDRLICLELFSAFCKKQDPQILDRLFGEISRLIAQNGTIGFDHIIIARALIRVRPQFIGFASKDVLDFMKLDAKQYGLFIEPLSLT
jgi:hypothetical protein